MSKKAIRSFLFLSLVFQFVSFSSQATCIIQQCKDSDGGNYPHIPGQVNQSIKCATPGGPVTTRIQTDVDSCKKGIHREYVCEMNPYVGSLVSVVKLHKCKCNDQGTACQGDFATK